MFIIGFFFCLFIVFFTLEKDFYLNYAFLILAGIMLTFFLFDSTLSPIAWLGFILIILGSVFGAIDILKDILFGMVKKSVR
jgi:membrane-bound ClpP family serine protease